MMHSLSIARFLVERPGLARARPNQPKLHAAAANVKSSSSKSTAKTTKPTYPSTDDMKFISVSKAPLVMPSMDRFPMKRPSDVSEELSDGLVRFAFAMFQMTRPDTTTKSKGRAKEAWLLDAQAHLLQYIQRRRDKMNRQDEAIWNVFAVLWTWRTAGRRAIPLPQPILAEQYSLIASSIPFVPVGTLLHILLTLPVAPSSTAPHDDDGLWVKDQAKVDICVAIYDLLLQEDSPLIQSIPDHLLTPFIMFMRGTREVPLDASTVAAKRWLALEQERSWHNVFIDETTPLQMTSRSDESDVSLSRVLRRPQYEQLGQGEEDNEAGEGGGFQRVDKAMNAFRRSRAITELIKDRMQGIVSAKKLIAVDFTLTEQAALAALVDTHVSDLRHVDMLAREPWKPTYTSRRALYALVRDSPPEQLVSPPCVTLAPELLKEVEWYRPIPHLLHTMPIVMDLAWAGETNQAKVRLAASNMLTRPNVSRNIEQLGAYRWLTLDALADLLCAILTSLRNNTTYYAPIILMDALIPFQTELIASYPLASLSLDAVNAWQSTQQRRGGMPLISPRTLETCSWIVSYLIHHYDERKSKTKPIESYVNANRDARQSDTSSSTNHLPATTTTTTTTTLPPSTRPTSIDEYLSTIETTITALTHLIALYEPWTPRCVLDRLVASYSLHQKVLPPLPSKLVSSWHERTKKEMRQSLDEYSAASRNNAKRGNATTPLPLVPVLGLDAALSMEQVTAYIKTCQRCYLPSLSDPLTIRYLFASLESKLAFSPDYKTSSIQDCPPLQPSDASWALELVQMLHELPGKGEMEVKIMARLAWTMARDIDSLALCVSDAVELLSLLIMSNDLVHPETVDPMIRYLEKMKLSPSEKKAFSELSRKLTGGDATDKTPPAAAPSSPTSSSTPSSNRPSSVNANKVLSQELMATTTITQVLQHCKVHLAQYNGTNLAVVMNRVAFFTARGQMTGMELRRDERFLELADVLETKVKTLQPADLTSLLLAHRRAQIVPGAVLAALPAQVLARRVSFRPTQVAQCLLPLVSIYYLDQDEATVDRMLDNVRDYRATLLSEAVRSQAFEAADALCSELTQFWDQVGSDLADTRSVFMAFSAALDLSRVRSSACPGARGVMEAGLSYFQSGSDFWDLTELRSLLLFAKTYREQPILQQQEIFHAYLSVFEKAIQYATELQIFSLDQDATKSPAPSMIDVPQPQELVLGFAALAQLNLEAEWRRDFQTTVDACLHHAALLIASDPRGNYPPKLLKLVAESMRPELLSHDALSALRTWLRPRVKRIEEFSPNLVDAEWREVVANVLV